MCNVIKTHLNRYNDGGTFTVIMPTRCTRMSIFGGGQEMVSFTITVPNDNAPYGCFMTCFATKIPTEYKQGCLLGNFGSQEFNEKEVIVMSCLI